MNEKYAYIYILTNKSNNVLYIGVTSDLKKKDLGTQKQSS